MESSFERRGPEPEKKDAPGISQERIDAAFAILARDGQLFEQSPSIIQEALSIDGIEVTDEELVRGVTAKKDTHGERYVEIDVRENLQTGDIAIEVRLTDKFDPASGEPFDFKKTYRYTASPEVRKARQEAQDREQREWDEQKADDEKKVQEMLPRLFALVGDRLGERLTSEEWKNGVHGVMEVFGSPESVPDGGTWTVEKTPANATRLTFYGADERILDIVEFGQG